MKDEIINSAERPPRGRGSAEQGQASPPGHESSILDHLLLAAKYKKLLAGVPLAAGIITAIISLVMPVTYTATARILPPEQGQSSIAAMMLSQMVGGPGVVGGGGAGGLATALGLKNPADLYVGILKGRTVTDAIIDRFKLRERYAAPVIEDTRLGLEKHSRINATKDTIITIEVDDRDPKVAAEMANSFVEELEHLTDGLALTEAKQRRIFFESQLKQAKSNLVDAEFAMRKTQEQTGLLKLDDQGRVIIETLAALRAQIAVKEVELETLQTFATPQNPELIRMQQQLHEMRSQLAKMEQPGATRKGDILLPTGKMPEAGLEYIRSYRDVKYFELIYELLAKQYEIARLDEARSSSLVQVIDRAVAPERRSWPKRTLMVIVAMIAGLLVAWGIIFVSKRWERIRRNELLLEKWQLLFRLLRAWKT